MKHIKGLGIMGFGARWAGGCTSGHGISGTMQMAVSSWVAAVCFFVGGIAVARIGSNVRDRRDYEEDQAYYSQQQANAAQQQANAAQYQAQSSGSAELQIRKLDDLRSQGLITQDEYNTQKQRILDNL